MNIDDYDRLKAEPPPAPSPGQLTELIDGQTIPLAPPTARHAEVTTRLGIALRSSVSRLAILAMQAQIAYGDRFQPRPDLVLLKPQLHGYRDVLPTLADVQLVVEVSDTTLDFDLGEKRLWYAKHGASRLWVVDLKNNQVHYMRDPSDGGYQNTVVLQPPKYVRLTSLPVNIQLARLFG
jgi:Uma2 family endonuclease